METLIKTPFFCVLLQKNGSPINGEEDLYDAYKEFASLSVQISMNPAEGIPAYFTLNYTLAELTGLQDEMKSGAKKKCAHRKVPAQSHAGHRERLGMASPARYRPQDKRCNQCR